MLYRILSFKRRLPFSKKSKIIVKGVFITRQYRFLQFHMHWGPHDKIGSEHLVNGESYAAEVA